MLIIFLLFISVVTQADDLAFCKGSILQRRLALVQFGQLIDAYIIAKGALSDLCSTPPVEVLDGVPELLKNASVCGSSEQGAVYYSCQLMPEQLAVPQQNSPVIESCRYSLLDQSVSCENRSVVTTFEQETPDE